LQKPRRAVGKTVTMGIDPTASTVTLLDPETGKGRVTYLCEGQPTRLFQPTPGLWFSNQSDEVRAGGACARVRASARGVSVAPRSELTRPAAAVPAPRLAAAAAGLCGAPGRVRARPVPV
jgi:hypothetical protein